MQDRELLELAAKAAGLNFHGHRADHGNCYVSTTGDIDDWFVWSPLTDDGDALRLAVRLELCIEFGSCEDDAPVVYCGRAMDRRDWPRYPNFPDSGAATRRAIVRAAAALAQKGA